MTSMTHAEFSRTETAEKKRVGDLEATARHLVILQQAEVSAENLTGNPDWDVFLSYIQAFVKDLEVQRQAFRAKLDDPMINEHAEMLKAKIGGRECAAIIQFAQVIMSLPKDIIEQGEKARPIAERLKDIQELEAKRESEAA